MAGNEQTKERAGLDKDQTKKHAWQAMSRQRSGQDRQRSDKEACMTGNEQTKERAGQTKIRQRSMHDRQ
jgi:hypothetical protein